MVLKISKGKALIYAYRKNYLDKILSKSEAIDFLKSEGYMKCGTEACLECLSKRLCSSGGFPHEIGVFLGYPLSDIKAFIKNKGRNFKCIGFWKVYTNEKEAKKTFEKFKKCTEVYCEKQAEGFEISKLTVAV